MSHSGSHSYCKVDILDHQKKGAMQSLLTYYYDIHMQMLLAKNIYHAFSSFSQTLAFVGTKCIYL